MSSIKHHKIYFMTEGNDKLRKCSRCPTLLQEDYEKQTCSECLEYGKKYRQQKRKEQRKCKKIKDNGNKCTYKVSDKGGNKYCTLHCLELIYENDEASGIKRCKGRTMCYPDDPEKAELKAPLPINSKNTHCENCRMHRRAKENNLYTEKITEGIIIRKENYNARVCPKCPRGTIHNVSRMGITQEGTESPFCKTHFTQQQEIEDKRETRDRSSFIDRYREYKRRAARISSTFNLSENEAKDLFERECYYCDFKQQEILNGIDRICNELGYIDTNLVTCCTTCNMMKSTHDEATFILMCAQISKYRGLHEIENYSYVFNDYKCSPLAYYKYRANKKEIVFDLTEDEFNEIRNNKCYLCGRKNTNTHTNGIDRIDNNKGYTKDNCKACCRDCNIMKRDLNSIEFVFQCGLIIEYNKDRLKFLSEVWEPSKGITKNDNKTKMIENGTKSREQQRLEKNKLRYTVLNEPL